jgi:DNA polymerase-4
VYLGLSDRPSLLSIALEFSDVLTKCMTNLRKIIHVDLDAFYASVEQRDNPVLRGKPVAVGGSPDKRGAVAAASYEARAYGVYSATPSRTAKYKCPDLIFVPPRFEVYKAIAVQIREVFHYYTDLVEPVALDEAYLDVTENKFGIASAQEIAQLIRSDIFTATQLTASAGVSVNKFLAKMASGLNKPNGMAVILPHQGLDFVSQLPIEKFHGIGKVTATKLHEMGIFTGADLRERSLSELIAKFRKVGRFYYQISRGEDERLVVPNRVRKSVSVETSYDPDLNDRLSIEEALEQVAIDLHARLEKSEIKGQTLTLKVKFADYSQVTRSVTQSMAFTEVRSIQDSSRRLLGALDVEGRSVRLLGLGIGKLMNEEQDFQQLRLEF